MGVKPTSKPFWLFLVVWGLIFLGSFLRTFKADVYPTDNNDDGLFYVWAGNSLWNNPLLPISHTIFEDSGSPLIWRSQFRDFVPQDRFGMKIARPWFDHPPLGTLLIALPARLVGYTNFAPIPQILVRYPALIASSLTLLFTYLLAKRLFGTKIGLLSLLLLATIPYFVIAHRQSFLENIQTPMFLACLLLLLQFQNKKSQLILTFLTILSSFLGWIKFPGFFLPFLLGGWLFYKKQWRAAGWLMGVNLVSLISYIGYGFAVDFPAFWVTFAKQGARGAFVNSFFYGLTRPEFYGEFADGWYVLGFIASLLLLIQPKTPPTRFFSWFFTGWLLILFLVSGRLNNSPWYRYPLLPFLAIALAFYIRNAWRKHSLFWIAPLFLLGLTGFDLLQIDINPFVLRLATGLLFAPFVLAVIFRQSLLKQFTRYLTQIFIAFLLLFNIYVSLNFTSRHCRLHNCLPPTRIILQP